MRRHHCLEKKSGSFCGVSQLVGHQLFKRARGRLRALHKQTNTQTQQLLLGGWRVSCRAFDCGGRAPCGTRAPTGQGHAATFCTLSSAEMNCEESNGATLEKFAFLYFPLHASLLLNNKHVTSTFQIRKKPSLTRCVDDCVI
jgi:hypothetical protein